MKKVVAVGAPPLLTFHSYANFWVVQMVFIKKNHLVVHFLAFFLQSWCQNDEPEEGAQNLPHLTTFEIIFKY